MAAVTITTIISGGQTGVDLAGLDAGLALGLKVGGFVPYFYDDHMAKQYNLTHMPSTTSVAQAYVARTIRNVDHSDATVIFKFQDSPGTDGTIRYAHYGQWRPSLKIRNERGDRPFKPYLIISSLDDTHTQRLRNLVTLNSVSVLNIAGHRDHKYYQPVKQFLIDALQ